MKLVHRIITLAIVVLLPILASCSGKAVSAAEIRTIAQKLNCICGSCDIILADCTCETAEKQIAMIKKGLAAGHSEEQVIRDMVNVYGLRSLVQ